MESLETLNALVGIATLAGEILLIVLLIAYFKRDVRIERLVVAWALPTAFTITIAGTALSLVYSMYFGIAPCPLCWMQRVFLYSQVVLFAVALAIKDTRIYLYSIVLSAFGLAVAFYQHLLQMSVGSLPCPASPEGVSCAKRFIFEFGHITFPWAACVTFALIIVLMLYLRRSYLQHGGDTVS